MISICVATRDRSEVFKRMWSSLLELANNPDNLEFCIYRDNDDDAVYEYPPNYKLLVGKRLYPDASINECCKMAKGDIFLFIPDDVVFLTKDWDKQVEEEFEKSQDKIIFLYFKNLRDTSTDYGLLGCLHRNWVNTVGYLFNPKLCRRGDVWINQISRNLKRRIYLPTIEFWDLFIQEDKTHQEYIDEIDRTNNLGAYRSRSMKNQRVRDGQALQAFINKNKKSKTFREWLRWFVL